MVKESLFKIFLLLFFIILGASFFHDTALAVDCSLSPSTINDHQTEKGQIVFTIDTHSGVAAGDKYDVWVGNGCNQSRGGGYCQFSQKGISLSGGLLSFTVKSWNGTFQSGMTQNVNLYHSGQTSNPVCTMPLSMIAAASWGTCDPLNFSPSNPKPTDSIIITPSNIASGQNGTGYGPDDTHHIVVYDTKTGNSIKEFGRDCSGSAAVTGKSLAAGFGLGTFDQTTNGYKVQINNCNWGNQFESSQCEQIITVSPKDGGGGVVGTDCFTCLQTDHWDPAQKSCVTISNSKTGPATHGDCGTTGTCVQGAGCTAPNGGGGIYGASPFPPPPPTCEQSGSQYICHTAIGNIETSAQGFVQAIMGLILSIVGGIAVLLIIVSGYRLMVSQGNPEGIKNAKDQLTAAIIGLLFVIFSLVILQIIGYNILGLPGFKP